MMVLGARVHFTRSMSGRTTHAVFYDRDILGSGDGAAAGAQQRRVASGEEGVAAAPKSAGGFRNGRLPTCPGMWIN